jgi:dUTP pyrophosphatase
MNIPILLTHEKSRVPTKAKRGDAGYDLYAVDYLAIQPGERMLVHTGVSMAIPPNYYGRIAPRSGLALKRGIDVLGGVIDSSYRGELGVILINTSKEVFGIDPGDKVAQLIIEACHHASFTEVQYLDETDRGDGGFGSTGV